MCNKRILIIDDDVELCEEIADILRAEGYAVTNISDSIQGQKLIKKHTFDLVILDYKLPGLNGIDLLKSVKEKNPQTKVFITSGRPFIENLIEEEKVSGLIAGIIKKPFNCEAFLEKITGEGV